MSAKSRLFKKLGDEFVIFYFVDIFLPDCSSSVKSLRVVVFFLTHIWCMKLVYATLVQPFRPSLISSSPLTRREEQHTQNKVNLPMKAKHADPRVLSGTGTYMIIIIIIVNLFTRLQEIARGYYSFCKGL